ncbi:MAG: DNA gyrase subunit A [Sarcina sp.]
MEQKKKSDNLRRLKGADRVRTQVNVDLGSSDIEGVQQGLFEVVSNSIDRFRRGYGNYIEVIKNKDLSYEVRDYADGLPMDWNEDELAYNWELAMRVPWAGGNYDHDSESLGQHGKGLSSTLLSSKKVKVVSYKNGYEYEVNMIEGRPIHKDTFEYICDDVDELFSMEDGLEILKKVENINNEKGTHTIWLPDNTLFTNINIPIEWICQKLKKQTIINSGLTIKIIDNYDGKEYSYCYEEGILDYLEELSKGKSFSDTIHFSDKGRGRDSENKPEYDYRYEFVMSFNNEVNLAEYYHNSSELLHGGSTAKAIEKALVDVIHNYCNENNLYKKDEKKIRYTDISDSLLCVISSFSNRTSFTNQNKLSITNEFIREFTSRTISEKLTVYFIENSNEAKRICEQILINKRASERAEKSRLNLKKKLSEEITLFNRPQGLLDCKSKDISENRLFIAEGQSAKSGLVMGRDRNIDAIFPIRGKILNCLKADYGKIFDNDVVLNIVRILGCGVEVKTKENKEFTKFDIDKCKYGKIVIATDSDFDGYNIRALVLTLFYRLMPSLIKEGRVYLVEAPLFEIECEGKTYYAVNNREKDNILKMLGNKKVEIGRNKGIGETSAEATADTIMNPSYKGLYQITMDDLEKANESFELFMGDKVAPRKEFIIDNFDKYCDENIVDDKEYSSTKDASDLIVENEMPYSTYTITERALPLIEDGLKPSQRRGMYTLKKSNVLHNKPRLKSSNVEGRVMALHSHSGIYPTLARMARKDTLNIPFLDSKGAMGIHNSDDINESAPRYTELRLSEISQEYFKDIDKNIVPMLDNYDNTLKEPKYLPVSFPAILCNTTIGIATGFSSNICPYNFEDVCNNAAKEMRGENVDILIPDFSTGGYIVNDENTFKRLHEKGLGTVKQRSRYSIVEDEIIFTELPYMSTVEKIEQEIIELVKNGNLKEIVDVSNDTDKNGLALSVKFKKNTNTDMLIEKLYKTTNLENTFSCNFTVLHNDRPIVLGVKDILNKWCDYRIKSYKISIKYDMDKIGKDIHLYEGLSKIVTDTELVINIISNSEDDDDTVNQLKNKFNLTETQAKYISDLQLKRLNKNNISKQISKLESLKEEYANKSKLLNDEGKIRTILASELETLPKKYNIPRKSTLIDVIDTSKKEDILIEDYNVQFVLTRDGYFKKIRLTSIKSNSTHRFKDGDVVISERNSSNKADLLIFTSKQNCYKLKANDIPDHKTSVLGLYLPSHLQLEENEYIVDIIPTIDYKEEMLVAFNTGRVVRLPLSSYETKTNRTKLIKALHIDKVIGMEIIDKEDKYLLESSIGRAMIFNSKDIMLKISKSSQGISVMKHKEIEIINFVRASTVNIDNISKYLNCRAGKPLQLLVSTNEIKE